MTNQTASDREREEKVAEQCATAWGCEHRYLGALDGTDRFLLREGRVVGVFEVKCRDEKYDTVWVALRKWSTLVQMGGAFGVPALFVVAYWDKGFAKCRSIGYFNVLGIRQPPLLWGGRKDRGLHNDMEPMLDVPVPWLTNYREPFKEWS